MRKQIQETITVDNESLRIDKYLIQIEEIISRNQAVQLIKAGSILVNDCTVKPSYLLQLNDKISITFPEAEDTSSIKPYDFPLNIVHEDDDIIVINKPAGLVMHPSAGHESDTLVNALIHHTENLSMGIGEKRPGIVHRIDKDTSGLVVIAKNNKAHEHLSNQFKQRSIHRIYHAVIFGSFKNEITRVESYLKRHPTNRKKNASEQILEGKNPTGKLAITHITQLQLLASGLSKIQCKLETGRTHQIRIHTSESGHPIVGDDLYGGLSRAKSLKSVSLRTQIKHMNRFALHAAELGFSHPSTDKNLFFTAEWPEDLEFLIC